jgi:hypothetical protein
LFWLEDAPSTAAIQLYVPEVDCTMNGNQFQTFFQVTREILLGHDDSKTSSDSAQTPSPQVRLTCH